MSAATAACSTLDIWHKTILHVSDPFARQRSCIRRINDLLDAKIVRSADRVHQIQVFGLQPVVDLFVIVPGFTQLGAMVDCGSISKSGCHKWQIHVHTFYASVQGQ